MPCARSLEGGASLLPAPQDAACCDASRSSDSFRGRHAWQRLTRVVTVPPRQIVDLEEVVLPGNARLFHHDNECFDWGTLGWIMSAGMVDIQDYKYYIMVNSSVRGPYAPPYQPVRGFSLFLACPGTLGVAHAALSADALCMYMQLCALTPPCSPCLVAHATGEASSSACELLPNATGRSVMHIVHGSMRDLADARWEVLTPGTGLHGASQAEPGLLKLIGWEREVPAWHAALTRAFDNDTHLVGPAISCEGMHEGGDPDGEWRANPHVLSHALAVDQVRGGCSCAGLDPPALPGLHACRRLAHTACNRAPPACLACARRGRACVPEDQPRVGAAQPLLLWVSVCWRLAR